METYYYSPYTDTTLKYYYKFYIHVQCTLRVNVIFACILIATCLSGTTINRYTFAFQPVYNFLFIFLSSLNFI